MKSGRPRLLAVSLAVAVVVSLVGGYVWSQTVADDSVELDARLTDSQDRAVPGIATNEDLEGDLFPSVVVLDRNDDEIDTASFLGDTPLVVNFWFSSCIPCERELPDFAEVDAEVGDSVRFIGINTVDSVPVMERFAGERGVEYDLYQDEFAELIQAAGIAAFPQTLFITSDGVIVEQTGEIDADELRTRIAELEEKENS